MRGHLPAIAMRRAGACPSSVWLHDMPGSSDLPRTWPADGAIAHVELDDGENPKRLDLRFTAGLTVFVHSTDAARLQAITDQALLCGAKRVLGARLEGLNTVEMTDTDGAFVWHA